MSERTPKEWLYVVVKLCAPMEPEKAAEGAAGMLPAIAQIPLHKLTDESAAYVASKCKRMPNYGTICGLLDEWWAENRPVPTLPMLAAPDTSWQAQHEKAVAQCREDWSRPETVRSRVAMVNGLYCRSCDWWAVSCTLSVCPKCGGRIGHHPMQEQMGRLLGLTVSRHAPDNIGLVPPEWHPNVN